MNTNVILSQYCSFATKGFSEMKLKEDEVSVSSIVRRYIGDNGLGEEECHARKHLPARGERKRDDEEHEQSHLRHQ